MSAQFINARPDIRACLDISAEEKENTQQLEDRLVGTFDWHLEVALTKRMEEVGEEIRRQIAVHEHIIRVYGDNKEVYAYPKDWHEGNIQALKDVLATTLQDLKDSK